MTKAEQLAKEYYNGLCDRAYGYEYAQDDFLAGFKAALKRRMNYQ